VFTRITRPFRYPNVKTVKRVLTLGFAHGVSQVATGDEGSWQLAGIYPRLISEHTMRNHYTSIMATVCVARKEFAKLAVSWGMFA